MIILRGMLREALEEVLYWGISIVINLILFTFLTSVFIVKVKEVPDIYPLKVDIVEIEKPKEKRVKSVTQVRSEAKKTVAKKRPPQGERTKAGVGVSRAHEKGDVKVPEEEDVSVLAEIQKKVEERLRKRQVQVKKEIGSLSAVVRGGEVKIRGGTRRIVYTPPLPELVTTEFPSSVRVRIWVSPDGRVVRAVLVRRSGSANIDSVLLSFVRGIRFERVQEREVQVGEITFSFQGG
ncbi:MAG: TonB family protein [Aquificota bacterium]|nr:TonB family protein [Aquificota bacterium]